MAIVYCRLSHHSSLITLISFKIFLIVLFFSLSSVFAKEKEEREEGRWGILLKSPPEDLKSYSGHFFIIMSCDDSLQTTGTAIPAWQMIPCTYYHCVKVPAGTK